MVELMHLGAFAIIFIVLMGFISNQNPTALNNIQEQFNRLTCPMPAQSGLWNSTGTLMYSGKTYNYANVTTEGKILTLTCTQVHTPDGFDYAYGDPVLPFAGFPFFVGDLLSELVDKLIAFFTLVSYYLAPINFEILGFTLADLGGFGLIGILSIYGFCYILIGILIYKIVSPFSGVG